MNTRRPAMRRGSTYVLILMVSMLLVVIGLGGLTLQRVAARTTAAERHWRQSGLLAQSATEQALLAVATDPWWREVNKDYENAWTPEIALGAGHVSWKLDDLADSNLDDNPADPLRIHGRGRVGLATRVFSVLAWPTGQPLDVLRTPLHATGDVEIDGALDVRTGPVSSSATLDVTDGQVIGDVEAAVVLSPENVSGQVLTPAPEKQQPSKAIWDALKARSTQIRFNDLLGGNLEDVLVSPSHHPLGADTNADGVYRIKVSTGMRLRVRRCRIEGTLLVELGESSRLELQDDVVLKPYRPDFPAMIVYTNRDLGTTVDITCAGTLSETASGVNFNPPDAPYFGSSDDDLVDDYPASLRGVIHVIRDVVNPLSLTTIDAPRKITGCIVVDGLVRTVDGSRLAADPTLLSRPPIGYATAPDRENLLANGDIEAGPTGWTASGTATVEWKDDGHGHAGLAYLKMKDRAGHWAGVRQDVTAVLDSGETYESEVWLEMRDEVEDVKIVLVVTSSGEGTQRFEAIAPSIHKSWTLATVQHTPTWTGSLESAYWLVETTTSDQEFRVDDALLAPLSDAPPPVLLSPMAGTWRAEELE